MFDLKNSHFSVTSSYSFSLTSFSPGDNCEECADGFYRDGSGSCVACGCDETGSSSSVCDKETGQCPCIEDPSSYDIPRTCFSCDEGTYFNVKLQQCNGELLRVFTSMKLFFLVLLKFFPKFYILP